MANVWILNHYAGTPGQQGTRHFDLARELVLLGHQATVFASSFDHARLVDQLDAGERSRIEHHDGVRFIWVRTPTYRRNDWRRIVAMCWYPWGVIRASLGLRDHPTVVIGSSPHLFGALAGYVLARLRGARFFFEVRDVWPQGIVDHGVYSQRHPVIIILGWLERFLLRRAEKIITLLPAFADYAVSRGASRSKVVWIPNGVNMERVQDLPAPKTGSEHRLTLMYLGHHRSYNSLDTLLDAAELLQQRAYDRVQIVLVGDGPEKPALVARAQMLGLRNVEFRSTVPKRELPTLLAEADAFIFVVKDLAVLRFGMSPNKLYDYMSAGRPVVCAARAANDPIAEAGGGISVPPEQPTALADAIMRLASMSYEERLSMGRNALQYVKRHHDMAVLGARLAKLIDTTA